MTWLNTRLIKKKGEKNKMGAWWAHEKSAHQKKMGLHKKKKWALDGRQPKKLKIILRLFKNFKKSMKKVQKKVKTALQKKMGAPKKKNGRKNGREKKRPFFFNGRSQKKKKGNAHFFGIDF